LPVTIRHYYQFETGKPVTTAPPQQAGLQEFLYSEVLEESNGIKVTVLSLLSRIGLDPWREADRLAHLPQPAAARYLARVILSGCPSCAGLAEAEVLAAGPIVDLSSATQAVTQQAASARSSGLTTRLAVMFAILWAALYYTNHHGAPSTSETTTAAPASTSVPTPTRIEHP
jgi:hypothetical protein